MPALTPAHATTKSSGFPEFLSARRSTNQTIEDGHTWGRVTIDMNSSTGKITYDPLQGYFMLEEGKTYRITAQLGWLHPTKSSPLYFSFELVDYETGDQFATVAEAVGLGSTYKSRIVSAGFFDVIYSPPKTGTYYLRVLHDDDGRSTIPSDYVIRADVSSYLNIVELVSGGPLAYLSRKRSSPQTITGGTWANVNIKMNSELGSREIEYTENGNFTLKAGVTYHITAQLGWKASSPEFYAFGVFNAGNDEQIGPLAEALPPNRKTWNVSGGVLDVIYTPDEDGTYCLRMAPNVTAGPSSKIRHDVGTCLNIVVLQGTQPQEYVTTRLSEDQSIPEDHMWDNHVIIMDTAKGTANIRYETESGQFQLVADTTYRITAHLGWETDEKTFYAFGLFGVKHDNQIGPLAEVLHRELNTCNASGGVLDVIFTPRDTEWYHLKMDQGVKANHNSVLRKNSTFMNIVAL
jgi:hypothetical protein